ncbi:MAG: hypothetical protein ACLTT1_08250 [[Clostridium] scindens]
MPYGVFIGLGKENLPVRSAEPIEQSGIGQFLIRCRFRREVEKQPERDRPNRFSPQK